jgi:hypothetical protein
VQLPSQQLVLHQVGSLLEVLLQEFNLQSELSELGHHLPTFNLQVPWPVESSELPFGLWPLELESLLVLDTFTPSADFLYDIYILPFLGFIILED